VRDCRSRRAASSQTRGAKPIGLDQYLQSELFEHRAPVVDTTRVGDLTLHNLDDIDARRVQSPASCGYAAFDHAVIGSFEHPFDVRKRSGGREPRKFKCEVGKLRR